MKSQTVIIITIAFILSVIWAATTFIVSPSVPTFLEPQIQETFECDDGVECRGYSTVEDCLDKTDEQICPGPSQPTEIIGDTYKIIFRAD